MVMLQSEKLMSAEAPSIRDDSIIISYLPAGVIRLQKHFQRLLDFVYTLYLFTAADIFTFTIPTTLFALFGSISGVLSSNGSPSLLTILTRIPAILVFIWTNLLIFNISNQRSPSAILEDTLNKPHRPLPRGLITPTQSRGLLLISIPLVLALSFYLGPWQETLLLFASTWMYNDLGGCDEDFITRNIHIAVGYGLYNSGALRIACGVENQLTRHGIEWIVLTSAMIFTTEHICDLKDQAGDKARGRSSAPIVLGDGICRWTIALPVIFWSILCPAFFGLGFWGYAIPVVVGTVVAVRTVIFRTVEDDSLTWKIWALWTAVLFALPLAKEHSVVTESMAWIVERVCIGSSCPDSLNLVGVSSMAVAVKSRKLRGYVFGSGLRGNETLAQAAGRMAVSE